MAYESHAGDHCAMPSAQIAPISDIIGGSIPKLVRPQDNGKDLAAREW